MCVFCFYVKMFVKCMCKCIVSQVWMLQCVVLNENIWLFCGFTCEWVLFGCVCAFMNVVCVCIHVLIYSGRKVLLLVRSSISFFAVRQFYPLLVMCKFSYRGYPLVFYHYIIFITMLISQWHFFLFLKWHMLIFSQFSFFLL